MNILSLKPSLQGILSTVCLFSNEGIGAYTASKVGFDTLIKSLRKEVRKTIFNGHCNMQMQAVYPWRYVLALFRL